jgi:hypothetical protein
MKVRVLLVVLCLAAFAVAGCSKPKTGAMLKAEATKALDDAKAARAAKDPNAAWAAVERAKKTLEEADAQADKAKGDKKSAAEEVAASVQTLMYEALKYAELAGEDEALALKCKGWAARSYSAARKPTLEFTFAGLSLAAEFAYSKKYESLTPEQKQASALAQWLAPDLKLANGQPDWKAIGDKIAGFGTNPPPELHLVLATALASMDLDSCALVEAQAMDPATASDPRSQLVCRAVRGVVYRLNSFPRLAAEQFEAIPLESKDCDPQLRSTVHLAIACCLAASRDWDAMEAQVDEANRAWPNQPAVVLLLSEVKTARHRPLEAAKTLETLAESLGPEADPWLAGAVLQRAKELRELKPGSDAPLLVTQAEFLRQFIRYCIRTAATNSDAAKQANAALQMAEELGQTVKNALPGGGGSTSTTNANVKSGAGAGGK